MSSALPRDIESPNASSPATWAEMQAQIAEALEADSNADLLPHRPSTFERLTSRLSLLIAAALLVCITILAVGYFATARDKVNARAKQSSHPLDWLLWFGGAKNDQTFQKYIKDSSEKSQREWDEKYRNSPVYQANPQGIDWKRTKWNLSPPTFNQGAKGFPATFRGSHSNNTNRSRSNR